MKKIINLLLLSQLVSSCFLMPPGAPHTHFYKGVDQSDSQIKLKIFCTPNEKEYVISGTEENDSVYISSSKMKKNQNDCLKRNFFGETAKSYSVRIGDSSFHRKLLNDTVKVEIVKPDLTRETYKFIILKDNHIKG